METNKKIQFNNLVLIFLISALTSFIIIIYFNSKSITNTNTNTININSQDTKDKVDLNTASESELKSLPGVGKTTAKKIISNRPYKSVHDLENISGIGKTMIHDLEGKVKCN